MGTEDLSPSTKDLRRDIVRSLGTRVLGTDTKILCPTSMDMGTGIGDSSVALGTRARVSGTWALVSGSHSWP